MSNFEIEHLDASNYSIALESFFKAMKFTEEDTQKHLIGSIELFYKKNLFISLGIKETSSNDFVGFGSLIPLEDRAWIPYFGIDPNFQRRGLGKKLIHELINIANEKNWKSIELCATTAGFPLYKAVNFKSDYPVNMYKIKGLKEDSTKHKLQILQSIPEWVYLYDKEVVDEERRSLLNIHNYDHLKVITKKDRGYGILYGSRIGPIIADSSELAKDIIICGYKNGGESFLLVEDSNQKTIVKEAFELESGPIMQVTKMTYGKPINQRISHVFGLRSFAYG